MRSVLIITSPTELASSALPLPASEHCQYQSWQSTDGTQREFSKDFWSKQKAPAKPGLENQGAAPVGTEAVAISASTCNKHSIAAQLAKVSGGLNYNPELQVSL